MVPLLVKPITNSTARLYRVRVASITYDTPGLMLRRNAAQPPGGRVVGALGTRSGTGGCGPALATDVSIGLGVTVGAMRTLPAACRARREIGRASCRERG